MASDPVPVFSEIEAVYGLEGAYSLWLFCIERQVA